MGKAIFIKKTVLTMLTKFCIVCFLSQKYYCAKSRVQEYSISASFCVTIRQYNFSQKTVQTIMTKFCISLLYFTLCIHRYEKITELDQMLEKFLLLGHF